MRSHGLILGLDGRKMLRANVRSSNAYKINLRFNATHGQALAIRLIATKSRQSLDFLTSGPDSVNDTKVPRSLDYAMANHSFGKNALSCAVLTLYVLWFAVSVWSSSTIFPQKR